MAQQTIGIGTVANDGTGDPIRDAFDKCNDNFTELYTGLVGLLDFRGATDCSANPNYPAASKGDFYVVSVAGKIGGASGTVVEVGDAYFATADNAGGTQAAVGTSWAVVQGNIVGGTITEIDDIPDVNAPTPAAGDVLTWDDTPGEWVPQAPSGITSFALGDATDVDTAGAAAGSRLEHDGSGWVSRALDATIVRLASSSSKTSGSFTVHSWVSGDIVSDPLVAWVVGNPSRFTCPSGFTKARITICAIWASNSTGSRWAYARANANNANILVQDVRPAVNESSCGAQSIWITGLTGGTDYIDITFAQNTGGALNLIGGSGFASAARVMIEWAR